MTLNKKILRLSVFTVLILSLVMLSPGTTNAGDIITGPYNAMIRIPSHQSGFHDAPIISFEYAEQNMASNSAGRGFSKVEMTDILVTKVVDDYSPWLFLDCAKDSHYQRITITLYNGDVGPETDYITITLEDVTVSSYTLIGESGIDAPRESFTLRYSIISYRVNYTEKGWDLESNKEM